MRKTIIYILLLGIFGFGVWYFLFDHKDLYAADEAGFTIKKTYKIHRIYLADKKGESVTLTRNGDNWIVDGKYKASPRMTSLLMEALSEQEAQYPAPTKAHDNIIKSMAGRSVKVELYDEEGKAIRVFYVGGQAPENAGTYMLIEGAKRPYVVQLPVFTGYLTPRYSPILDDWRDRTLLAVDSAQIKQIDVTYHYEGEELNTFSLQRAADKSFTINTHPELMKGQELNKVRTNNFANFFTHVGCEGYINGSIGLDSIIANTEKRLSINILTKDDKQQHLDIYWMPVTQRSKNLLHTNDNVPDEYDPDRMYAITNNMQDTLIIQTRTFDKILRKGFEFYQPDE